MEAEAEAGAEAEEVAGAEAEVVVRPKTRAKVVMVYTC